MDYNSKEFDDLITLLSDKLLEKVEKYCHPVKTEMFSSSTGYRIQDVLYQLYQVKRELKEGKK